MRTALAALATLFVIALQPALAEDGKAVFENACASCHTGGIGGFMSGAPDIDDKADWQSALAKNVDELTTNTIEGFGGMPPRGKCADCSDAQIRAAVEYMVQTLSD